MENAPIVELSPRALDLLEEIFGDQSNLSVTMRMADVIPEIRAFVAARKAEKPAPVNAAA